jgi:predicted alpha/beta hydrolase family esterase
MTKTALLIHGAFGSPDENWFPWLNRELENLGYEVLIPKFPTPENQNLANWEKVIAPYLYKLTSESIIIGHSLGVPFGLRILEKLNQSVKAFYGAAGFIELLNNPEFDTINRTFTERDFAWSTIKTNGNKFFLYHSDNDPYVPMSCAENLASKLNTRPEVVLNGGHLNASMGFTKFPQLLKDIKSLG